jgi:hypothetical protein
VTPPLPLEEIRQAALDRTAAAMNVLAEALTFSCEDPQPECHWSVVVSGVEHDDSMDAIAAYATAPRP